MSDEIAYQPRVKVSWLFWTLAAFVLFAAIGAYSARMTRDYSDYDQDRAQVRYDTLTKLQGDEQALIEPTDAQGKPTAAWVDQDKGVIRLPVEEAMAKEVDTLQGKAAAMGLALPGAVPAAASAPTNAAPGSPAPPTAATPPAAAKPTP
jgi:hypothetical protein